MRQIWLRFKIQQLMLGVAFSALFAFNAALIVLLYLGLDEI